VLLWETGEERFHVLVCFWPVPIQRLVGLFRWGISPSKGRYIQRTAQHRKTRTNEVKAKGKVVLVLDYVPRHEGVSGKWRYSSTHSLTSALDGGEWSASRPGRFTRQGKRSGTHWIGGWVGPRTVLNAVKRKIPSPRLESNLEQGVSKSFRTEPITK
jgi:hypothetical protein